MDEQQVLLEVMLFATVIAPIVVALVQLMKKTANIKVNLIPLFAFIIGLIIGALAWPFTEFDLTMRIWAGGIAGLSATGLFEIFKDRQGTTKGDW